MNRLKLQHLALAIAALFSACSSGGGSTSGTAGASSATGVAATSASSGGAASGSYGSSGGASSAAAASGSATASGGSTGAAGATSGGTTGGVSCQPATTNPLYVDGAAGVDSPCCGSSTASSCLTLTQAMGNIVADALAGYPDGVLVHVIEASVSAGGPDWTAPETWPVTLTFGVTLHAPGLYFSNHGATASDLFHAHRYNGSDSQHVTIQGDSAAPVHIGYSASGDASKTLTALAVSSGLLDIQDAVIDGTIGILIAGANVQIGPDALQIGSIADGIIGQFGVICYDGGQINDNGATVAGQPVLAIEGQTVADLTLGVDSNLLLTNGGQFGPSLVGGVCPTKVDTTGIDVRGGTLQASHVLVECQKGDGILEENLAGGFVDFDGTVQHNGCAGVHVLGPNTVQPGTAIAPTVITSNHYGILADADGGIVSLGINDHVTVACDSASEPGNCLSDGPAVDLWQQGAGIILAAGVTWQATPTLYFCDDALDSCTWDGGAGALPSPAEAVISGAGKIAISSPSVAGVCP